MRFFIFKLSSAFSIRIIKSPQYLFAANALLVSLFSSCQKMQYGPNVIFNNQSPQNLNQLYINKLLENPSEGESIRIVLTGDSQNHYDDSADLVGKVNTIDGLDFLIHAGDLVDFGMFEEYMWMHDIFSKLYIPYITVVGNHDVLNNGKKIFKKMYGPLNHSFVYKKVKFIYINTNSREFNFNGNVPDLNFLRKELMPQEGVNHYIIVSHVPPYNEDFDREMEQEYTEILSKAKNVLFVAYGHVHYGDVREDYNDGVTYLGVHQPKYRMFHLVEIKNGEYTVKNIEF